MEILFLIGQYQLHLNYIGHISLFIIHTIRLAALYQMYGMFFTPCMVVFLHPIWYCPLGEITVPPKNQRPEHHSHRCTTWCIGADCTSQLYIFASRNTSYSGGYQQDGPD